MTSSKYKIAVFDGMAQAQKLNSYVGGMEMVSRCQARYLSEKHDVTFVVTQDSDDLSEEGYNVEFTTQRGKYPLRYEGINTRGYNRIFYDDIHRILDKVEPDVAIFQRVYPFNGKGRIENLPCASVFFEHSLPEYLGQNMLNIPKLADRIHDNGHVFTCVSKTATDRYNVKCSKLTGEDRAFIYHFTPIQVVKSVPEDILEHDNYGITHTLPYPLVSDMERRELLNNYKFKCRCCDSSKLKRVLSLGYQPLANNLLKIRNEEDELFPLEMNYCSDCHNCQLSHVVDPKKMFSSYLYLSSTSETFRKHFENAANKYIKEFKLLPKKSYIIDVGSNDGVALKPFKNLKYKNILGIEPAKNLARLANKEKIKTYNGFLDKKTLKKIKKNADLILASNVFAHSDELKVMAECMLNLIKKSGTIVIEVQYLLNTLKDVTFDNIYHEHYNYWSLTSLVTFFKKLKAVIYKAERIDTHGGSIRIYVKKNFKTKIEKSVKLLLKEEERFGIKNYKTYQDFAKKVYRIRENVRKNILELKKSKKRIIGYGSPAKATTAMNFFGISNEIECIIEDNKLKQGKFLPGMKIPIVAKSDIKAKPDCALVLAWNFFQEIKKNNSDLAHKVISIKDLEI